MKKKSAVFLYINYFGEKFQEVPDIFTPLDRMCRNTSYSL